MLDTFKNCLLHEGHACHMHLVFAKCCCSCLSVCASGRVPLCTAVTQVHIAERLAKLEERTASVTALSMPLAETTTVQVCLLHGFAHADADCPRRQSSQRLPCLMSDVPVDQAFATCHLLWPKVPAAAARAPCKPLAAVALIPALCERKTHCMPLQLAQDYRKLAHVAAVLGPEC